MKKLLLTMLVLCLVLGVSGCSGSTAELEALKKEMETLRQENQQLKETLGLYTGSGPSSNSGVSAVTVGQEVEVPDVCGFKVTKTRFTDKVTPTNPTGYYTYYQSKEAGNTYLEVVLEYKNLKGDSVEDDDIGDVEVVYDAKYHYSSFCVVEEPGGGDFNPLAYLKPLMTYTVHFICQVPVEVRDSDKPVVVALTMGGNEYVLKVR